MPIANLSAFQSAISIWKLRKRSDEIARLNRTIAESITGGDSYCYVMLSNGDLSSAILSVIHQGTYPVCDVGIRIVDVDQFDARRGAPDLSTALGSLHSIGNLPPGQASLQGRISLPGRETLRFNIFISARNGMFTELLRMRYVNGDWLSAMRVERVNHSDATPTAPPTLLKTQIDETFPRNKDGDVDRD